MNHLSCRLRVRQVAAGVAGCCLYMLPYVANSTTLMTVGPFDITFFGAGETDGSGTTGVQNWTNEQITDVVACVGTWTSNIANVPGRQLTMHCFWNDFGTSTLGSSYNPIYGNYAEAWTLSELVWRQGVSFSPASNYYSDTRIVYDNDAVGYGWNFGDDAVNPWNVDFRSVVTHELGHTLGFAGTYNSTDDTWWAGGITAWNALLRDSSGNAPAPGTSGAPGNFNQLDNPVYFTGARAMSVYGGPVPVYAPGTYAGGSSLTHLDEAVLGTSLMSPMTGLGESVRSPGELEWAIMQDIGWTLVPEPGTFATAALGLLALVWRSRRRLQ